MDDKKHELENKLIDIEAEINVLKLKKTDIKEEFINLEIDKFINESKIINFDEQIMRNGLLNFYYQIKHIIKYL